MKEIMLWGRKEGETALEEKVLLSPCSDLKRVEYIEKLAKSDGWIVRRADATIGDGTDVLKAIQNSLRI